MPQNTDIAVGPGAWVLLTDANVTAVTLQVRGAPVLVKATVGAVAPTNNLGAFLLKDGEGITGALADHWRGVLGANRVYAKAQNFGTTVVVSHA